MIQQIQLFYFYLKGKVRKRQIYLIARIFQLFYFENEGIDTTFELKFGYTSLFLEKKDG